MDEVFIVIEGDRGNESIAAVYAEAHVADLHVEWFGGDIHRQKIRSEIPKPMRFRAEYSQSRDTCNKFLPPLPEQDTVHYNERLWGDGRGKCELFGLAFGETEEQARQQAQSNFLKFKERT